MIEPLLNQIRDLEKANRRWKTLFAILATVLLALMVSGGIMVGYGGHELLNRQRQARDAMEAARAAEMEARMQAERARQQALEAVEQQQKIQAKQ